MKFLYYKYKYKLYKAIEYLCQSIINKIWGKVISYENDFQRNCKHKNIEYVDLSYVEEGIKTQQCLICGSEVKNKKL